MKESKMTDLKNNEQGHSGLSRRKFLGYAGGIAGAALLFDACKKEDDPVITDDGVVDLGTNDNGLLNLMFVLEQIEAAFYRQVLDTPYDGFNNDDFLVFDAISKQELAHREVLRNYLKNNGPVVTTDFSTIDFSNKKNVLENAEIFEELVTSTYNEIGRLFVAAEHVLLVSKMATVEARQAATIANMRNQGSFFGPVDVIGTEPGTLPSNTISIINRFLSTKVSGDNLPNK